MARAGPAGPITRAFRRYEEALSARGSGRDPTETARELFARTGSGGSIGLHAFEEERYAAEPPTPDKTRAAVKELDEMAQSMDAPAR